KSIAMLCVIALVVAAWRHDTAHALTYSRYHLGSLSKAASAPTELALQRFPFYRAQEALNRLPDNAVVLWLRPADMYYAQRQMVSYLDPRLIPAYRERTPEGIARRLEALGVTHIYRPNYSIPPIYRSALMPMLSDARFVSLEFTDGYYDLYKLKREATDSPTAVIERLEVSPDLRTWGGESESRFMRLEGI